MTSPPDRLARGLALMLMVADHDDAGIFNDIAISDPACWPASEAMLATPPGEALRALVEVTLRHHGGSPHRDFDDRMGCEQCAAADAFRAATEPTQ
jgi:hypothetical protein